MSYSLLMSFSFFLLISFDMLRSWDMSKFLNIQCRVSRIKYPSFAKKWINIRKSYGNFYKVCTDNCSLLQEIFVYLECPVVPVTVTCAL